MGHFEYSYLAGVAAVAVTQAVAVTVLRRMFKCDWQSVYLVLSAASAVGVLLVWSL
jgi:hypothetical protein